MRAHLAAVGAHSYRADPDVPPFPDDRPVIVFDGVCVLCSRFARFVAARDHGRRFRFLPAQSPLGEALMRHYGLDPVDFETNLLIEAGRAHGKLDAAAAILRRLGPHWAIVAAMMRALPPRLADWLYDRIAQNRYAIFGRTETCIVPDASWRDRLLDIEAAKAS